MAANAPKPTSGKLIGLICGAIGELARSAQIGLPKKLLKEVPCGRVDKAVRLPVGQDDQGCIKEGNQNDGSAETGILAIVINDVHAANVSGEPLVPLRMIVASFGPLGLEQAPDRAQPNHRPRQ